MRRRLAAAVMPCGMQVAVSVAGLALGVGMLASGRGETAVYLPVVTSIVGYWLPAPRRAAADDERSEQASVGPAGYRQAAADADDDGASSGRRDRRADSASSSPA